jgi:sodium-dependent dicarboxylate transporter 2/3/5
MSSERIQLPEGDLDRARAKFGLVLAPIVLITLLVLDMGELSPVAQRLAAIIGFTVVLWVCETLPLAMTAMLSVSLCVLFGVAPVREALGGFADPIVFLFIGSFILAEAMCVHRLDRRIALTILSQPAISRSMTRVLLGFGAVCAALSMWLSNTATAAMMTPVALGVLAEIAALYTRQTGKTLSPGQFRAATGLLLMIAYGSSMGGLATPIGSPPNLIGIGFIERTLGERIGFFDWMKFALPLVVLLFGGLFVALRYLHPPELQKLEGLEDFLQARRDELGPMTVGERSALIAFSLAVACWVAPGIFAIYPGDDHPLAKNWTRFLPEGLVPIYAACMLFVLPGGTQPRAITWAQATRIDWGTVILFAAGICLGSLMFSTGLADALGKVTVVMTGVHTAGGILFVSIALAILVSEAASNTASANMIVPVCIAMALAAGVDPVLPALGATFGASFGFMMPVSTAPNAIVHGTGMVPIPKMIKTGGLFDLCGLLVLWAGLMAMNTVGLIPQIGPK